MSVDKSWHTIFDVQFERRATYAAKFEVFERHKGNFLDILRRAHKSGPKSEPFDEANSWQALIGVAVWYFRRPIFKQKTVRPARLAERLRDLAKALGRARVMARKARQDDVGVGLFGGWFRENKPNKFPVPMEVIKAVADEITEAEAGLAKLEAAARRAARDVPKRAGPPSGTGIVSMHDLIALKGLYQRSTGLEPSMGGGPFVQLVEEFLTAVERGDDTSEDYVVETLKYARKRARKSVGK